MDCNGVLKYGMVGDLRKKNRVAIWCVKCEDDVSDVVSEVQKFVPTLMIKSCNSDGILYRSSDEISISDDLSLVFGFEWFCYSFETGLLSKVTTEDVYKYFTRAI